MGQQRHQGCPAEIGGHPLGRMARRGQGVQGLAVRLGRRAERIRAADAQCVLRVVPHQATQHRALALGHFGAVGGDMAGIVGGVTIRLIGGLVVGPVGYETDEVFLEGRAVHHQTRAVVARAILVGLRQPVPVLRGAVQQIDAQPLGVQQRGDGAGGHPAG
ncbi:hypothetical protein GCM10017744_096240 [Streptomyces antimycoticus]|uniref:Uncharacterized protein n=1 Tax=Streptomyces antimycoticus TaxID=68175 RepID=A0A4D4JZW5_9ACTN|nr:hypothetical protein [Streptomyces antimycoticus]GDY39956.1 hypothetical protein SANT12839_008380 [Streptomyces antimycoticus]